MTESKLVEVNIDNIYPHPDNPRKDLGDLSELAESIKKNGIMQKKEIISMNNLVRNAFIVMNVIISMFYLDVCLDSTEQLKTNH